MNHLSIPTVSIDKPSGLLLDTGGKLGEVTKSDHTVSFIGKKRVVDRLRANMLWGFFRWPWH